MAEESTLWQFRPRRQKRGLAVLGIGCLVLVIVALIAFINRPVAAGRMAGFNAVHYTAEILTNTLTTPSPVPATPAPVVTPTATWQWPIHNEKFVQGFSASHHAWDLSAKAGTAVFAVAAGRVIRAGWNDTGYGNLVVVEHADQIQTWYGHLQYIVVVPGQAIAAGGQIGVEGGTGNATGLHVHFEVRVAGMAHDPAEFLVHP